MSQVIDPAANNQTLAMLSGVVPAQSIYTSSTQLRVIFTTDEQIALKGFHMTWYEEDIPTTTTTTSTTTTPTPTTPYGMLYMITRLKWLSEKVENSYLLTVIIFTAGLNIHMTSYLKT